MTNDTAHVIYTASVQQIAGLEAERQAHLMQIAALVDERDALREQCAHLREKFDEARLTLQHWLGDE